ncbi:MAG TPA: hypothetical protein VIX35_13860, partial [Vicinamibacterales bacterium]
HTGNRGERRRSEIESPGHRRLGMTTTSRVRAGAMAAALAAFAVSGCSGSTGGSGNTAQGASSAATAKADASGALDVCALLPVTTVASITGESLTGSTSSGISGRHACEYGANTSASVVVVRPGGAADYAQTAGAGDTPVSGLGDKAFYNPSVGIVALFGDTEVQAHMGPFGALTQDQISAMEQSMVKALQPKL